MPYPFAREHGNRTTQPMSNGRRVVVALGLIAGVGAAAPASAQQAKQQGAQHPAATVEIRGQVPTPQFITVRPREIPAYRLELPAKRDFTPTIGSGYSVVWTRPIAGASAAPSLAAADSIGAPLVFAPLPASLVAAAAKLPEPAPLFVVFRKPYSFCASLWWCPKHEVREPLVAADFPRR